MHNLQLQERVANLHLLYRLMLRALRAAATQLDSFDFRVFPAEPSAVPSLRAKEEEQAALDAAHIRAELKAIMEAAGSAPCVLPVAEGGAGLIDKEAALVEEFLAGSRPKDEEIDAMKAKFRNVSSIIDCVGCSRCKLWGKIQTQGIGAALKLLMGDCGRYIQGCLALQIHIP